MLTRALPSCSICMKWANPKETGIDERAYVAETAKIGKDVYIAPFACIGDHAEVGDNTVIHPHATVGGGAKIGSNCILYANSTVYHDCRVGNNCILHAGCVIGADGFGFAPTPQGYEKIPQIGNCYPGRHVEVGAILASTVQPWEQPLFIAE